MTVGIFDGGEVDRFDCFFIGKLGRNDGDIVGLSIVHDDEGYGLMVPPVE